MRNVILIGALVIASSSLSAGVVEAMSVERMTQIASRIVEVDVSDSRAQWDGAGKGIWTQHTVNVRETIKGHSVGAFSVTTRGGVVGRKGQHVAGEAKLIKGKRYLLFLERDAQKRWRVVGMAQGCFRIESNWFFLMANNGAKGLTRVDATTGKAVKSDLNLILSDLKARVRDAIQTDARDQ